MMTFTELTPGPATLPSRSPTGCDWQLPPTSRVSKAPPASTPHPTCAATCDGQVRDGAWVADITGTLDLS
jgi:hypothetical protein